MKASDTLLPIRDIGEGVPINLRQSTRSQISENLERLCDHAPARIGYSENKR